MFVMIKAEMKMNSRQERKACEGDKNTETEKERLQEYIKGNDRLALATRLFTVYFGLQSHFSSYWQSQDDFLSLFIPVWISVFCAYFVFLCVCVLRLPRLSSSI